MKKTFLSLLLLAVSGLAHAQSTFTPSQENLRGQIETFLKKEGLTPERQSDGLKFKKASTNGGDPETYYIEIDKEEKSPMFLRLRRYVKYSSAVISVIDATPEKINSANVYYGVKVFKQDREEFKGIVLSAEMFVTSASEFTNVYSTLMSQIKNAYDNLKK